MKNLLFLSPSTIDEKETFFYIYRTPNSAPGLSPKLVNLIWKLNVKPLSS
jgi:hypothetical protein